MRLKMRSASHRESECSEAGRPSSSKKEGSCPSFCSASKISSRSVFSTRLVFVPIGGRRRTGKANAARPDGHPAQKRKARARVSAALRRSLRGRSFRRAWSSCRSEVGVAPGKRMQRGRTAIQLKKGRLVPEFLQRFEDLFAVGLFDALGLRADRRSASHRESECSEAGRPSSSKKEGSCPSFCSASKISSRSVFSTRLVFVLFLRRSFGRGRSSSLSLSRSLAAAAIGSSFQMSYSNAIFSFAIT